ncbi:MAG: hypothetical protein CMN68_01845 [Sphingomonadaceae bacterium]|nr:hypothetical protein [Sphingomonadaceae bacterium]
MCGLRDFATWSGTPYIDAVVFDDLPIWAAALGSYRDAMPARYHDNRMEQPVRSRTKMNSAMKCRISVVVNDPV